MNYAPRTDGRTDGRTTERTVDDDDDDDDDGKPEGEWFETAAIERNVTATAASGKGRRTSSAEDD